MTQCCLLFGCRHVDFSRMEQKNTASTGAVRPVQRVQAQFADEYRASHNGKFRGLGGGESHQLSKPSIILSM